MNDFGILYDIKTISKEIELFIMKDHNECNYLKKITPTQIMIIDYIINSKEKEIYQKNIEKRLNLSRATLSGVLKTMEKNGIIKRVSDNYDGRTKKIILNDDIKKKFINFKNKVLNTEKIIISNISKEELTIFKNIIDKMKNNINTYKIKERND